MSRRTDEMILCLQNGIDREENFRLLFRRYYRLVSWFIARRGFAPDQCENLVQETFMAVFMGLPKFRQDTEFEGWILGIARNLCAKAMRQGRAAKRFGLELPIDAAQADKGSLPTQASSPFDNTSANELRNRLSEALDELPQQMRDCATLRFIDEMTYREIATNLAISVDAVKVQLNRARKKLRLRLGRGFQSTLT